MQRTNWNCFVSSIEMSYRNLETNFYHKLHDSSQASEAVTSVECQKEFLKSFTSIKTLTSKLEFIKRMRYLFRLFKSINYYSLY